jgi:hypothetical protein
MNQDILEQAEELLGKAVKVETNRDWGIFWCPFHNDSARAGNGGHANFGVHLEQGYWACLRCGAKGGSLNALRLKLGKDWKPIQVVSAPYKHVAPSQTALLDEALAETRAHVQTSPAWAYLAERGLEAYTALVYGLGYGLPKPFVSRQTLDAAYQSRLVMSKRMWLWAGSVVYADPPIHPSVINVRYLPDDRLPPGTRTFVPEENHRTWGNRIRPLGSWRIGKRTKTLVVLEGLFDMLLFAQALRQRGMDSEVTAVYTNGACPSARMLDWFSLHNQYDYLLIRDPDEAGTQWTVAVAKAIQRGNGNARIAAPPDPFDPDEAILHGWWPSNL